MNGVTLLTGTTDVTSVVSVDMFDGIINTLSTTITPELVLGVLAAIVGFSAGYMFLHWGARKVTNAFNSAFSRGKLRV